MDERVTVIARSRLATKQSRGAARAFVRWPWIAAPLSRLAMTTVEWAAYFTEENEVGARISLITRSTIGPFASVSARALCQAGSA